MSDKTNQDPAIGPADPLAAAALNVMESAQSPSGAASQPGDGSRQPESGPGDGGAPEASVESGAAIKDDSASATESAAQAPAPGPEAPEGGAEGPEHAESHTKGPADSPAAPEQPESGGEDGASGAHYDGGMWSAIFNGLAKAGPLVLIAAIACLCWHDFWHPDDAVYCPAEFKGITAFLHSVAQGSWLAPFGLEHGAFTAPQWPGFYWFIGLLALIPGLGETSMLLPLAEALAATLAVLGVWALTVCAGFGIRPALAAGLILLCAPLFAPLPHFMGPAPFAAACMVWSLFFFYRGWRSNYGFISLPLAFLLAGLAGLSGGVLHFVVPLVASIAFLLWTGKWRRCHALDALAGFALMLCLIGGWLGWVILDKDNGQYLQRIFDSSLRLSFPSFWFLGLVAGILGVLPWILMIFGVSWIRVCAQAGKSLAASRQGNGSALIWTAFAVACAMAAITPAFHPAAVAIACLLSVLLGKAIGNLSRIGNRFFFLLASLALIIAGALLLCMSFGPTQAHLLNLLPMKLNPLVAPTLLSLKAAPVMGGLVLAGGLFGLFFARRSRRCGGLVYAILLVIALTQVGRLMLVPELAANPDLPLIKYSSIVASVEEALAAPAAPAASPESVQPAQAAPAPENVQPAAPEPQPAQEPATPPAGPGHADIQPAPESAAPQPTPEPAEPHPAREPDAGGAAGQGSPDAASDPQGAGGEAAPAPEGVAPEGEAVPGTAQQAPILEGQAETAAQSAPAGQIEAAPEPKPEDARNR